MTRGQRLTFLGIAAAIAVVAVILLATGGDETDRASNPAQGNTATATATATADDATPTPKPPPLLTADHERALTFNQGETVRFRVRHDEPDEVHVHGYDSKKDLEPGKTVTVAFKGDITGIFEIELERSGTLLAQLKVVP